MRPEFDYTINDENIELIQDLSDYPTLNITKTMGAILNPLFQNKECIVVGGLCTNCQYETDTSERIRWITRAYDRIDGSIVFDPDPNKSRNEWSGIEDDSGKETIISPSTKKAIDEINL